MPSYPGREALPEVRGVLFDLDDTLYDRGAAFRAWASDLVAGALPAAEANEREDAVAYLIDADDNGYSPRPKFVNRVYARFPVLSGPSVGEFVATFRDGMLARIEIEEGAVRLIAQLSARQLPWGIVTNGETFFQQRKIDYLGLSPSAACVVISEAFGEKKPRPAIFRAAARGLGVDAGRVLFVGDHAVNDIGGAKGAGMQTAWLRRGRDWPTDGGIAPPDFTADDLHELILQITPQPAGDN